MNETSDKWHVFLRNYCKFTFTFILLQNSISRIDWPIGLSPKSLSMFDASYLMFDVWCIMMVINCVQCNDDDDQHHLYTCVHHDVLKLKVSKNFCKVLRSKLQKVFVRFQKLLKVAILGRFKLNVCLAVQTRVWDSSIPTPVTHSLTHWLTHRTFTFWH